MIFWGQVPLYECILRPECLYGYWVGELEVERPSSLFLKNAITLSFNENTSLLQTNHVKEYGG
jgi:hypothetical protein